MGKLTKILFTILVLGGVFLFFKLQKTYVAKDSCEGLTKEERYSCLADEFDRVLETYGVDEGFSLLTYLYEKDSEFPPVCHDYTHLIGEEAYKRFAKGQRFNLTDATSYCGYGFYHGFIISLFRDGKGKKEASEFCAWADKVLSEETNTTSLDCYHGVGHGMADFNLEGESKTNAQMVIDKSVDLCKQTGETAEQVGRCINGVFHSIFSQRNNGLGDIFPFCHNQALVNQEACFSASSSFVMEKNENDFAKSTLLTQLNLPEDFASLVIRSMAGYEAYKSINDWEKIRSDIRVCKDLKTFLKEECIRGLIEGLTDFGLPGHEESAVKTFCEDPAFSTEEKNFCFEHALSYFKIYFGEEKMQKLCELVGDKYCSNKND